MEQQKQTSQRNMAALSRLCDDWRGQQPPEAVPEWQAFQETHMADLDEMIGIYEAILCDPKYYNGIKAPMDAVLAEWVFVVYLSDASSSTFVFTGPYAVATFASGDYISLVPNAYYDCAEHRPDITIQKYSGGDALADAVIECAAELVHGARLRWADAAQLRVFHEVA